MIELWTLVMCGHPSRSELLGFLYSEKRYSLKYEMKLHQITDLEAKFYSFIYCQQPALKVSLHLNVKRKEGKLLDPLGFDWLI